MNLKGQRNDFNFNTISYDDIKMDDKNNTLYFAIATQDSMAIDKTNFKEKRTRIQA